MSRRCFHENMTNGNIARTRVCLTFMPSRERSCPPLPITKDIRKSPLENSSKGCRRATAAYIKCVNVEIGDGLRLTRPNGVNVSTHPRPRPPALILKKKKKGIERYMLYWARRRYGVLKWFVVLWDVINITNNIMYVYVGDRGCGRGLGEGSQVGVLEKCRII